MRLFLTFRLFVVQIMMAVLIAACGGTEDNTKVGKPEPADHKTTPDSLVIELTGVDSVSVLGLLLDGHQVDYRESLTGTFVTGIDSITAGDGYFWVYSVNDSMARIACDKNITRSGDRVKWHFRNMSR